MEKTHPLGRIGVLGDIHCEDQLLSVAIQFLQQQQLDLIVAVGDIADGRGDLNRTCDLLQQHQIVAVKGNHERWFLDQEMRHLPDAQTLASASRETLAYLRNLPVTLCYDTVAGAMLLCHGLGEEDEDGVWPDDRDEDVLRHNVSLQKLLAARQYDFLVNGHTHRRMVRRFDSLTIVNAGTLFYRHRPCFSLVDFYTRTVQFFDFDEAAAITPAEIFTLS